MASCRKKKQGELQDPRRLNVGTHLEVAHDYLHLLMNLVNQFPPSLHVIVLLPHLALALQHEHLILDEPALLIDVPQAELGRRSHEKGFPHASMMPEIAAKLLHW